MLTRCAGLGCVLGFCLLAVGCYNNPEINERPPGTGTEHIHAKPQVGPGTLAGGSTAGPQPPARAGHSEVQATGAGATGDTLGLDHAGAAKPEQGAEHPAATSRQGNEKGVGDRTGDPAKH